MAKRKKRLMKQIKCLEKQAERHQEFIEAKKGRKDTTPDYWKNEKAEYERQAKEREEILEKLSKKKS